MKNWLIEWKKKKKKMEEYSEGHSLVETAWNAPHVIFFRITIQFWNSRFR